MAGTPPGTISASKSYGRSLVEGHIDPQLVTPLGGVPAADPLVLGRYDARLGTGSVQGLAGLGQLGLLEAIVDQDPDLQSAEILIRHVDTSARSN